MGDNKFILLLIGVFIAVFVLFGVYKKYVHTDRQATNIEEQALALPPDFKTFYDHFHSDSAFQVAHIIFPLSGNVGSEPIRALDDWILHKPFDSKSGTFQREFEIINGIIIERIQDRSGSFRMSRRFAKVADGQWHLIYYAPMDQYGDFAPTEPEETINIQIGDR